MEDGELSLIESPFAERELIRDQDDMMKNHKIGAGLYALWGVVHVLGGITILIQWLQGGGSAVLEAMGGSGTVPVVVPDVMDGVAGYHFFNIMWIGLVVSVVAATMNWKNSRVGAWINLALVGFADAGLVMFMLVPGYISWGEGMIGIGLFIPAAVLTVIGTRNASVPTTASELKLRPADA